MYLWWNWYKSLVSVNVNYKPSGEAHLIWAKRAELDNEGVVADLYVTWPRPDIPVALWAASLITFSSCSLVNFRRTSCSLLCHCGVLFSLLADGCPFPTKASKHLMFCRCPFLFGFVPLSWLKLLTKRLCTCFLNFLWTMASAFGWKTRWRQVNPTEADSFFV